MNIWIPRNSGYWKNGTLIGEGQHIDHANNIIRSGNFVNGKLIGKDCFILNSNSNNLANIRYGQYLEDKEHGDIAEYVFSKDQLEPLINGQNISATVYKHEFIKGKWAKTKETT